jgi:bifunctional non-homologous end joining protein LigD
MLARSGKLPTRGEWAYEVKWDGFRAIVSTEGPLRVRSCRGLDMTPLVLEFSELLVTGTSDGDLRRVRTLIDVAAVEANAEVRS